MPITTSKKMGNLITTNGVLVIIPIFGTAWEADCCRVVRLGNEEWTHHSCEDHGNLFVFWRGY